MSEVARAKRKRVAELENEILKVMLMEPVELHEVAKEKQIGELGPWGPPGDGLTHAQAQCPSCGMMAHFFMPVSEDRAEFHKCGLCFHTYLVSWEVPDEREVGERGDAQGDEGCGERGLP